MSIRADLDHARDRRLQRRRAAATVAAGSAALLVLLLGVWIWRYAFSDLPSTPDAAGIARMNRPPSIVFLDRRGTEVGRRGPDGGEVLRLADQPPHVPRAFLAAEDRRFYGHGGVDPIGLARAAWVDLRQWRVAAGGSTITQQIARTLSITTATVKAHLTRLYERLGFRVIATHGVYHLMEWTPEAAALPPEERQRLKEAVQ